MKATQTVILAVLLAMGLGCGYSSKSTMPAMPGTMPAISALNPAAQAAGSASFPLEVDGSNFNSNAVVNFNGAAMAGTTWVNAGKLMVTIPASSIMTKGTVPVTVTNPGSSGGPYGGGTQSETSAAMNFTIN
jgi:hypothetical protein